MIGARKSEWMALPRLFLLIVIYYDWMGTCWGEGGEQMNHKHCTKINTIPVFHFVTLSLCLSGRLFFLCLIPHTALFGRSALLLNSLSVCTQSPLTNSEIKCPSFFIHERCLISGIVWLWMNRCNILEAVYLFLFVFLFCYLWWLVSAETQAKHSGGCQIMLLLFFFLAFRWNDNRAQSASSPLISSEKN